VWRTARSTPVVYYFRHILDTSATGSSVRLRGIRSAMFYTNSCGRSRSKGESHFGTDGREGEETTRARLVRTLRHTIVGRCRGKKKKMTRRHKNRSNE